MSKTAVYGNARYITKIYKDGSLHSVKIEVEPTEKTRKT